MSQDALITCLQAYPRPEDAEAWILADQPDQADQADQPEAPVPEAYRRAVHDLLIALGVISAQTGQFTSPAAYCFVQSLLCAFRDGALKAETWAGALVDECAGTGVRLVRLLESHRLACVAAPTPLRRVQAVMAIIKARRAGTDVYLMQYDQKAAQFQPLGGKRETFDASNAAALTRELCEELEIERLTPGEDFNIHPLIEHIKINTVSASLHVLTQYDHSFYHLTDVRFPIRTDSITRWITAAELAAGKTEDGYAISKLADEHLPGILATLGYSLPGEVS
jgi:8-oxo-dGTP pyrophosphatase MutT (NUDIX family)